MRLVLGGLDLKKTQLSNLTERCKRLATPLTSTQVTLLPWRSVAEVGPANYLHVSA